MNWPGTSAEWLAWEPQARWWLYVFGLGSLLAWETVWPRRELVCHTAKRWSGHAALAVAGYWIAQLVVPIGAVETALKAAEAGRGVLANAGLPWAMQVVMGVLVLDVVRFAQHWSFHRFGVLWRIHRVHHGDPDFDVTTALRFHPLELLATAGTAVAAVWWMGVPLAAVVGYELVKAVHALFSHANARMPGWLEGPLRWVLVTPDTHRVHHSERWEESMRNYGELFTVWDRMLGTFQEEPAGGHEGMRMGLPGLRDGRTYNPARLLVWPFADGALRADKERSARESVGVIPAAGD